MGYLMMILATLIWGSGFVATRWTLMAFDPFWANAIRFLFAGTLSLPFLLFSRRKLPWTVGTVASVLLFLGLHFQTVGISQTTLAKSGFFTVFYAIFTPLLMALWSRQKFRKTYWLLLALALLGIALLCELSWDNFNRGDLYVILSAFLFSLHILWIDHHAASLHSVDFNFLQCFLMGILGMSVGALLFPLPSLEPLWTNFHPTAAHPLTGFLILSVLSSLIAFTLQIVGQKLLRAHIISLIFLLESVFAAALGYLVFEEHLSLRALYGCGLVLLSVALIPWATNPKKTAQAKSL